MNYLLDTHTLLWFISGNSSLSKNAKKIIEDKSKVCFISIVSLWEIAIKVSLKKLEIAFTLEELALFLTENEISILAINISHLNVLSSIPFIHRDPFDRMIISQCLSENLVCISKDENVHMYEEITVIW
jgi:PIN domain nuclease of toxin-antitoxin system